MLQVKQIVNNIFTSDIWMLFDDCYDYCWLVDIGDYEKVAYALPPGIEIMGVFLTHTHFDHTYGINALHEASFTFNGEDVEVLNEGDQLELYPGTFLTAYATPGHCHSCLTYIVGDWIFTGDSYIPGVKVVTKLPMGDRKLAAESKERIMSLAEGKIICAGHGDLNECM